MASSPHGTLMILSAQYAGSHFPKLYCGSNPYILTTETINKKLDAMVGDIADEAKAVKAWWAAGPPPGFCELVLSEHCTVNVDGGMGIQSDWGMVFDNLTQGEPLNLKHVPAVTHIVALMWDEDVD